MASVLAELARLGKAALQVRHREVFGHRPKSHNEHHLRTALAKALTATSGPVPSPKKPTYGKAERQRRDRRLPPAGAVVSARVGDRQHLVTVLERGFVYRGLPYRSLSAIARAITGTTWNGFLFFGLERRRRSKGGEA
jgi:hypothetical protein